MVGTNASKRRGDEHPVGSPGFEQRRKKGDDDSEDVSRALRGIGGSLARPCFGESRHGSFSTKSDRTRRASNKTKEASGHKRSGLHPRIRRSTHVVPANRPRLARDSLGQSIFKKKCLRVGISEEGADHVLTKLHRELASRDEDQDLRKARCTHAERGLASMTTSIEPNRMEYLRGQIWTLKYSVRLHVKVPMIEEKATSNPHGVASCPPGA